MYTALVGYRAAKGDCNVPYGWPDKMVGKSGGMDHEGSEHAHCSRSTTASLQARMLSDCAPHSRHTSIRTVQNQYRAPVGALHSRGREIVETP